MSDEQNSQPTPEVREQLTPEAREQFAKDITPLLREGIAESRAKHASVRPSFWREPGWWIAIAAFALLISWLAYLQIRAANSDAAFNKAKSQGTTFAQQLIKQIQDANNRIIHLGGTPVPVPSNSLITGPAGAQGSPGPTGAIGSVGATGPPGPGPSDAQVAIAVSSYCSTHVCGSPPTAAQVLVAVTRYCGAHACTGPAGQNATDSQIQTAVAAYCAARNACSGPSGPAGPTGASGPSGASGSPGPPGPSGASGASGQNGYPPQEITIDIPALLGGSTRYYCLPQGDAGPGAQPNYACTTNSPSPAPS